MTHNILITGAAGQLGTAVSRLLPTALKTGSDTLDITDPVAVNRYVADHHVDTIINCAAYTAVDRAEDEPEQAAAVNTRGPENLAKTGARLIHISTDYVFDGTAHRPYTPADIPNPLSVYGKTKYAGEQAVLAYAQTALVVRTGWLYAPYGQNFVRTMLRLGREKETVSVVQDQVGTPTYAIDLAAVLVALLPQIKTGQKGIYHFANEGACSWYDLARRVMQEANLPCRVEPIPSQAYPTRARRPQYSVLDKTAIQCDFGVHVAPWQDALHRCFKSMERSA